MKKVLLVAAMAMFAGVNAQMQKGTWMFGAGTGLGFNSANTSVKYSGGGESAEFDGPTINTFTITPSVGYFVMDNLAVGLDLGFVSISEKEDDYKFTTNTLSAMPAATYFFYNEGKFIPYLGAGVGFASITYKEKDGSSTESETYDGFAWKGKGGLVYLINKNLGLDLGVSYNQYSHKETEDFMGDTYTAKTKVGTLGVNVGFTVFLGKTTKGNTTETN